MNENLRTRLRLSWRILAKEVAAFGLVGAIALVLDLAIYNVLLHKGFGPLEAKLVSTSVATTVAYLGNKHVSFSHRGGSGLKREAGYFFSINLAALAFAEVVLAIFAYPLDYKHDTVVMNLVNLFTIGVGTVFRFWSYKQFVFLHPDRMPRTSDDDIIIAG